MARPSSSKGVLTAVGVVLAAALLRAALHPWLSDAVPFITFFAAVAAASQYGGLWSGITAIVLSCVLADWFFIPPFYTLSLLHLDPTAWSELAVFSAMSGLIVGLSESMHSAKAAAQSQTLRAEDLARRVATALDNAQLFKSLQTADRQKDEFLAMLAHELRNPLAAIRYALELVRMPQVGPSDELLDMVDRQVGNLVRMIDDLLDISRISRGKIELHREPVDAVALVRKAAEIVQPLINEKNHTLVLELAEEPLMIDADATRVEQIIGNLLTNAAKYTPAEGRIDLWVRSEDGHAVIEVKDTGIGIAPDMLPHVFELFAQADKTLDRSQGGLGIGLTVVQKLTDLHGGTVAAASDGLGCGAKFTVRFPLVAAPATAPEDAGDNHDGDSSTAQRILIVEDNLDSARAEALLLKAHGHVVEVIHNGGEAVELARRFRPHAMLIDIGLPGLSGYDVASALRQHGLKDVKLIAVSGYGQAEDRERSLAAGFDHHLVKPVASDALFRLLSSGCSPVSASSRRSKKSGTP